MCLNIVPSPPLTDFVHALRVLGIHVVGGRTRTSISISSIPLHACTCKMSTEGCPNILLEKAWRSCGWFGFVLFKACEETGVVADESRSSIVFETLASEHDELLASSHEMVSHFLLILSRCLDYDVLIDWG